VLLLSPPARALEVTTASPASATTTTITTATTTAMAKVLKDPTVTTRNRDANHTKESVPFVQVAIRMMRLRDLPVRPR
jgi:hypothetical protein